MSAPLYLIYKDTDTRYLLFQPFQTTRAFGSFFNTPFSGRKRMQRYAHFPNCQNFFSFFAGHRAHCTGKQRIALEKFFAGGTGTAEKAAQNAPEKAPETRKSGTEKAKTRKTRITGWKTICCTIKNGKIRTCFQQHGRGQAEGSGTDGATGTGKKII